MTHTERMAMARAIDLLRLYSDALASGMPIDKDSRPMASGKTFAAHTRRVRRLLVAALRKEEDAK